MGDLSMAQVDRFMADRCATGARKLKTRKALGLILGHLRGLGLAPVAEAPVEDGPVAEILSRYRQFLTAERGLVPVTARRFFDCLRPFLDRRLSADGLDLGSLTAGDLTSFVGEFCPRLNGGVPVSPIPEQFLITLIRDDVVHQSCRLTTGASRVIG